MKRLRSNGGVGKEVMIAGFFLTVEEKKSSPHTDIITMNPIITLHNRRFHSVYMDHYDSYKSWQK